jgi:hypothetical protein
VGKNKLNNNKKLQFKKILKLLEKENNGKPYHKNKNFIELHKMHKKCIH